MVLWQLMHHVPKCMSCHKAIAVITRRAHFFLDYLRIMQAPKFRTLAITIYRYCNLDLAVTIAKIVQNVLETTKNYYYVFGPVCCHLTRSTILLKLNSFNGCFNQATFYDFQSFCQDKVVVKIFWPAQSLTLNKHNLAHIFVRVLMGRQNLEPCIHTVFFAKCFR